MFFISLVKFYYLILASGGLRDRRVLQADRGHGLGPLGRDWSGLPQGRACRSPEERRGHRKQVGFLI
jgi:hypothetical protein